MISLYIPEPKNKVSQEEFDKANQKIWEHFNAESIRQAIIHKVEIVAENQNHREFIIRIAKLNNLPIPNILLKSNTL
jgi:hypothetical protein